MVRETLDCENDVAIVHAPSNADVNPSHAVCTNRKFDFSGYAALADVEGSPSTVAFQPEPPALPAGE
ncbi:MAG: hypothetical protein HY290_01420 [Planctomycetia bacterium]|nr:hypothetical protein [Planctomycetia bacterium]